MPQEPPRIEDIRFMLLFECNCKAKKMFDFFLHISMRTHNSGGSLMALVVILITGLYIRL